MKNITFLIKSYNIAAKRVLLFTVLLFNAIISYAQSSSRSGGKVEPIAMREISGEIRDSLNELIPGAHVRLESVTDTLNTITNEDGIFVFTRVKSPVFVITVNSLGLKTLVKRFLYTDKDARIVLDPIYLKLDAKELKGVVINGTPSVIYKIDTIEYRASDYKAREYDSVDELLKKMEGFEVGKDGSLTHNGQQITKAKLNGKVYAGGDVVQAIKNLPADIVEKVQVVDDYGELAARTHIKDGDPQKTLNITTLADRSIGTTGRIIGKYGNNDRADAELFIQRLNANQELSVIAKADNVITGVASTGLQGGATNGGGTGIGALAGKMTSPGITKTIAPSLNYRDQWGSNIEAVAGYTFQHTNNETINDSNGQRYSSIGSTNFVNHSNTDNQLNTHKFTSEIDYTADQSNYLQITPVLSYSSGNSEINNLTDNINNFLTGFEHQTLNGVNANHNSVSTYNISALYVHSFRNPRRIASFQYAINNSRTKQGGNKNNIYSYYLDSTRNNLISDSSSNLAISRNSRNVAFTMQGTYVEPLAGKSQIELTGQVRQSTNDNAATSDSILVNGQVKRLPQLDNIYNYSFIESRFSLAYRYNGSKFDLTLGVTAVPSTLKGNQVNNSGNGENVYSAHSYFQFIPVFRASYAWSSVERVSLTYSGRNAEPQFNQLQPFVDRSDPNNIVIGNPGLKPTFINAIALVYNRYLPNSKVNFSVDGNYTDYQNQISSNQVQIKMPLPSSAGTPAGYKTINEITFVNVDDTHALVGRYSISKRFGQGAYNLSLNGNVSYFYNAALSNNVQYHNTNWRFDERLALRIAPTEDIEINPYVGYDLSRSFTTLFGASPTLLQTTSLAIDSRMYFKNNFQINYSAVKSFVSGIGNLSNNSPLVLNAGCEKSFLKRKNLALTFNIYDLLHQNNFIQQTITPQATTNTRSNALSRYFLFGCRLNLQKWKGTPSKNGQPLKRRGDGSFIY